MQYPVKASAQPGSVQRTDVAAPLFSVIIPTRNRPALLRRAVHSVLAQDLDDYELVLVDDGTSGSEREALQALLADLAAVLPGRLRCRHLVSRPQGHGPAFACNLGAALARGRYLCFLDDDDQWTDTGHLRRAQRAIARSRDQLDLYLSGQRAVHPDGRPALQPLWLAGVERHARQRPDEDGGVRLDLPTLLRAPGFAHMNASIFRRGLYEALGGMDEALRYENDRDIFLRAIDVAGWIVYNPAVVAQHHIPEPSRRDNVSTALGLWDKRLYQLRLCDKAIAHARHELLRRHARRAKGYTLKAMAEWLATQGRHREAGFYMREALLVAFSFKWLAYTVYGCLRALLQDSPPAAAPAAAPGDGARAAGVVVERDARDQPACP